jgi:hypothetical protein
MAAQTVALGGAGSKVVLFECENWLNNTSTNFDLLNDTAMSRGKWVEQLNT